MKYAVHKTITGTNFKQKGPSCQKKELQVNSTANTFQRKYENVD